MLYHTNLHKSDIEEVYIYIYIYIISMQFILRKLIIPIVYQCKRDVVKILPYTGVCL